LAFGRNAARKLETARAIASVPADGPPEALTVVRAVDPTNFLRKFAVFIDDARVGYIAPGEVRHYPVSPGFHGVAMKIDFCKSRELRVEKLAGKNVLINCGSTYNDWRCLFMFIFKPRDYLYLR